MRAATLIKVTGSIYEIVSKAFPNIKRLVTFRDVFQISTVMGFFFGGGEDFHEITPQTTGNWAKQEPSNKRITFKFGEI